ncbi:MAG: YutD family protein [Enterococcus lacertideformus]|uniref:YutD family protein n=1 Tax=Enterococcus lacertideformus TaxID=2771493 RepID=A0A931AW88_9ENTE|nr:YutD family protein [Enterococcus lacertideformus]
MSAKQKGHNAIEAEAKEKNASTSTEDRTVTEEITAVLEEIVEEPKQEKSKSELITFLDEINFLIGENHYRLVTNYREGFNPEKLGERYSEVLSRYDYIVGDWGYEQLRLKGFFRVDNRRAHPDQRIDTLEDYLYEYCNFGCAYFVIEQIGKKDKHIQRRRKKKNQNRAYIDEKKGPVSSNHKRTVIKKRKNEQIKTEKIEETEIKPKSNANFTIRKREE